MRAVRVRRCVACVVAPAHGHTYSPAAYKLQNAEYIQNAERTFYLDKLHVFEYMYLVLYKSSK